MPSNMLSVSYDLSEYPTIEKGHDELVFPNLASNTLLLIHLLIKFDVIKVAESTYQQLRQLLEIPPNKLTQQNIDTFNALIKPIKVNEFKKLTFLEGLFNGDGQNDFFMLKLLNHIQGIHPIDKNSCKYDLLLSRDVFALLSKDFIQPSNPTQTAPYQLQQPPRPSLIAMESLVDNALVSRKEIIELIKRATSGHLKLFSAINPIPKEKELSLLGPSPFTVENLYQIFQEFSGESVPHKMTSAHIRHCVNSINLRLTSLLSKQPFSDSIFSMMKECMESTKNSPFLAYLLSSHPDNGLQPTPILDEQIVCHLVFNQEKSEEETSLTLQETSTGKGKIRLASFPNRVLSYFLMESEDKTYKKLACQYTVLRDKFKIAVHGDDIDDPLSIKVPLSMTDDEAIRRLHLIFCDGEPALFFSNEKDPTQRQFIEEDLINLRYARSQRTHRAAEIPKRNLQDFFDNAPDITKAPHTKAAHVDGLWSENKTSKPYSVDVYLSHQFESLQIKTGLRYFPPKKLKSEVIDSRLAQALTLSETPYERIYTMFSTHYLDVPNDRLNTEEQKKIRGYTNLDNASDPASTPFWDFSPMKEEKKKPEKDEREAGVVFTNI